MGEVEEEQGGFLKNAEVYDLIAKGRVEELVPMGEDAIPGLVSILRNGESWKKAIAIDILERIEGDSSVRALKVAAEDKESEIRKLAVIALRTKKGEEAEKAIERMMGDPSGQIAKKAGDILLERKSSEPPPKPHKAGEKNGNRLRMRS